MHVAILHGSLTEWHNISTAAEPIQLDGVFYEDMKSIYLAILKTTCLKEWPDIQTKMYDHLVDYDNPHNVTYDQLKTKVIEILYTQWLNEGYKGSLETFIELLFRYLEFATWEDMIAGQSEEKITSVKIVADFIKRHDDDLYHAHVELMDEMVFGDPEHVTEPVFSYNKFIGLPVCTNISSDGSSCDEVITNTNDNKDIIILPATAMPDRYSFVIRSLFSDSPTGTAVNKSIFILTNPNSAFPDDIVNRYGRNFNIYQNSHQNKITFECNGTSTKNFVIDVKPLIDEIDPTKTSEIYLTVILVVDGLAMHGYVQLTGKYQTIPISSSIIHISADNAVTIPNEKIPPHGRIFIKIPSFTKTDTYKPFLESITYYKEALSNESLMFTFGIFE